MTRPEYTAAVESLNREGSAKGVVEREVRHYRTCALRLGVHFIGVVEKHWVVLFQDPVTGSSFAVKIGESVESGIERVRTRFGLTL